MLYVRPLDATSDAELPGTRGARSPFWSPDAQFIGFFADGKLKTIGASGGAVRTICDAPGNRSSGDWNGDGVILFGTDFGGAIQRVSASGGEPALLTTAKGRSGHLFPTWLPDSRHFLYYEQNVGIHRASLDSKDDILIIKTSTASWAKYVPSGYLVFVRGTELMAQMFDPARASFSGDPVAIGNVGTSYGDTSNGFSVASDGALAFQALEQAETRRLV